MPLTKAEAAVLLMEWQADRDDRLSRFHHSRTVPARPEHWSWLHGPNEPKEDNR